MLMKFFHVDNNVWSTDIYETIDYLQLLYLRALVSIDKNLSSSHSQRGTCTDCYVHICIMYEYVTYIYIYRLCQQFIEFLFFFWLIRLIRLTKFNFYSLNYPTRFFRLSICVCKYSFNQRKFNIKYL